MKDNEGRYNVVVQDRLKWKDIVEKAKTVPEL